VVAANLVLGGGGGGLLEGCTSPGELVLGRGLIIVGLAFGTLGLFVGGGGALACVGVLETGLGLGERLGDELVFCRVGLTEIGGGVGHRNRSSSARFIILPVATTFLACFKFRSSASLSGCTKSLPYKYVSILALTGSQSPRTSSTSFKFCLDRLSVRVTLLLYMILSGKSDVI